MKQIRLLKLYPMSLGLDRSSVPGTQNPVSLRVAKNVVCSTKQSLRKRPGQRRIPYIGQDDGVQAATHFFGTKGGAQFQEVIRVRKGRVEALRDLGGSAPQFVDLGVQVSDTDTVTFSRFGNALIIHFENTAPYYYLVGGTLKLLPILAGHNTSPPTISQVHDFRFWYSGRRANPSVVYASAPNNILDYSLRGGGFPMSIAFGDGDYAGITALSPTFKKDMYAYKWQGVYRISLGPYGYGWHLVTPEVGAVHHNAVASSANDLYSVDIDGWHSLRATAAYGGSEDVSLTRFIHEWFQDNVNWSMTKNMRLIYDKMTATLLLSYAKSGSAVNNAILGMNVLTNQFFEWEDIEYPAIGKYFEFGRQRTFVADEKRGICLLDKDENTLDGDPISVEIETGPIFPLGNPKAEVSFTQAWLVCRPTTVSSEVDVFYSIDGKSEIQQTVDMQGSGHGAVIADRLQDGAGQIGVDVIGKMDSEMATIPLKFGGEGASIAFRLKHEPTAEDPDKPLDIYGIIVEFSYSEDSEEVRTS